MVADDLVEFGPDDSNRSCGLLTGRWAQAPSWVDINDYIRVNGFYGPGPRLGYLKPLFRTSIFTERCARYDETLRIAEDYDLVVRLLHFGKSYRVYPMQLYYYRRHAGSISHRLNATALAAIKTAALAFLARISPTDRRLAASMSDRIRSIDTALTYEELLGAIKDTHWGRALSIIARQPRAALLLRMPIEVRLRRMLSLKRRGRHSAPATVPVISRSADNDESKPLPHSGKSG
jgi:succinoglycan biosynthesis protein ExoO